MSLFAGEPERIPLDETSWLEHFPGWLDPDAAASLLANLIAVAVVAVTAAVSLPGIRRQAGSSTGLQPGSRGGSARRSRTPAASAPAVPVAKLS